MKPNQTGSSLISTLIMLGCTGIIFMASAHYYTSSIQGQERLEAKFVSESLVNDLLEYFRSTTSTQLMQSAIKEYPLCTELGDPNGLYPDQRAEIGSDQKVNRKRTFKIEVIDLNTFQVKPAECAKKVKDFLTTPMLASEKFSITVKVQYFGNHTDVRETASNVVLYDDQTVDKCAESNIVSFETLPGGQVPNLSTSWDVVEDYMPIRDQYKDSHGVRFCKLEVAFSTDPDPSVKPVCRISNTDFINDGQPDSVFMGRVAGNDTAWSRDGNDPLMEDTVKPEYNSVVQQYFLGPRAHAGRGILIEYVNPVSAASGYLIDVDDYTAFATVTAYDVDKNLIQTITIKHVVGSLVTGDGVATKWEIDNSGNKNIMYIAIDSKEGGIAIDRFSPKAICP